MKYFFLTFVIILASVVNALPPYVGDGRVTPLKSNNQVDELVIPEIEIPTIGIDENIVKSITIPEVKSETITIPDIQSDIDIVRKNIKSLNELMIDKRNIFSDSTLHSSNNEGVQKWINIYKGTYPEVDKVPLPTGIQMIAEVRMPQDKQQAEILESNLAYRKAQGYNAVLVTFSGTEKVEDLTALVTYLKEYGFKVWFAFGGKEDLKESVFLDPEAYATYLQTLASVCDGFISHWRRTSSHLFIQDDVFMAYTAQWVRIGNPEIPIVGEIYFGETASIETKANWITSFPTYNVPNGINNLVIRMAQGGSGYLITNLSTANINVEWVMENLLSKVTEPKYILITGPSVYFLSSGKTNTTYEQDLKRIEQIKARWLNAGCIGVVITHGDGSDTTTVSDNMSQFPYTNIKK